MRSVQIGSLFLMRWGRGTANGGSSATTVTVTSKADGGETADGGGVSDFGLSPELLQKTKSRVRAILWLVFGANVLSFFVRAARAFNPEGDLSNELYGLGYVVANLLISSVGLVLTRIYKESKTFSLVYGMFLMVALCFVVTIGNTLQVASKHGHAPFLTWGPIAIIIFPLIVPAPPKITLKLALLASLSGPIAVSLAAVLGLIQITPQALVESLVSPLIATAVGYFGARIVYGLNADYTKAKDLGVYQLKNQLGEGGMGQVFRATHRFLARPAAIKLIRPEALQKGNRRLHRALERFEREAQAASQLRSPHTIEIYDFGYTDDGAFYYVMELLDGVDLEVLVTDFGAQPVARTTQILIQIAHSLREAHFNGLVHRDIKPANVFLCQLGLESDFVKVLDFGVVKSGKAPSLDTDDSRIVGSPAFLAPEQALPGVPVGPAADIYALGSVAYWLLTGSVLYPGVKGKELIALQVSGPPPTFEGKMNEQIPEELDALIKKCLAKEADARPENMDEVLRTLRSVAEKFPWSTEEAENWWQQNHPGIYERRKGISLAK